MRIYTLLGLFMLDAYMRKVCPLLFARSDMLFQVFEERKCDRLARCALQVVDMCGQYAQQLRLLALVCRLM